jgi:hypothetical protein
LSIWFEPGARFPPTAKLSTDCGDGLFRRNFSFEKVSFSDVRVSADQNPTIHAG